MNQETLQCYTKKNPTKDIGSTEVHLNVIVG